MTYSAIFVSRRDAHLRRPKRLGAGASSGDAPYRDLCFFTAATTALAHSSKSDRSPRRSFLITGSFVDLTGIAASDCTWAGVSIAGSFVRVDHALVRGAAAGIEVTPESRGAVIAHNALIDNNRMSVLTRSPHNDDSGAFGILLRGMSTLVADNRIEGS